METVMIALLSWIVANSTYAMPSALPIIEYRTEIEMRQMHFCEDTAKCDDAALPGIFIAALYDHEKRIMFLPKEFDSEKSRNKATLVHELTHHVQALSGKFVNYSCFGPLEYEAYKIEDLWLSSQGLPVPEKTIAQTMTWSCAPGPT